MESFERGRGRRKFFKNRINYLAGADLVESDKCKRLRQHCTREILLRKRERNQEGAES